jgi:hypothetical protein
LYLTDDMKFSIKNITLTVFCVFFLLPYLYGVIAIRTSSLPNLMVVAEPLVTAARNTWKFIGETFARISSLFDDRLLIPLYDLVWIYWNLFFSWTWFIKGYEAYTAMMDHPALTVTGSIIILLIAVGVCLKVQRIRSFLSSKVNCVQNYVFFHASNPPTIVPDYPSDGSDQTYTTRSSRSRKNE